MKRMKTFWKKYMKWIAPLIVILSVTLVCVLLSPSKPKRVTVFEDYRQYGEGVAGYSMSEIPGEVSALDSYTRTSKRGIIAVVKILSEHENVLGDLTEDLKWTQLDPKKTYPDIYGAVEIEDQSFVHTKAQLLDILYQSEETSYCENDVVELMESYFICDQRVPNLVKRAGEESYYIWKVGGWEPLVTGEVYLVYGLQWEIDWNNAPDETLIRLYEGGAFCLSDPGSAAGCTTQADQIMEGLNWLKKTYPDMAAEYMNEPTNPDARVITVTTPPQDAKKVTGTVEEEGLADEAADEEA